MEPCCFMCSLVRGKLWQKETEQITTYRNRKRKGRISERRNEMHELLGMHYQTDEQRTEGMLFYRQNHQIS